MTVSEPTAPAAVSASPFQDAFRRLADNVEQIIKGKREVVELALTCLFSEGHLLIEDVPGVGKTMLARSVAASLHASWHRIQFTPDLLPTDITGVSIYEQARSAFEFHPGPVFANVVLADEINRASPKTQSALLEVMEERRVTIDGHPHPVPRPFMVIATQNPIDMDGTYALPEAQLDRFLMRVSMGYPDRTSEMAILTGVSTAAKVDSLAAVLSIGDVERLVALAAEIHVAEPLHEYLVQVVSSTRNAPGVRLGASPRGSVALLKAIRVRAAAAGRAFAIPEDVKALGVPVLAHRLLLTPEAEMTGRTAASVITDVLDAVPVPRPTG